MVDMETFEIIKNANIYEVNFIAQQIFWLTFNFIPYPTTFKPN